MATEPSSPFFFHFHDLNSGNRNAETPLQPKRSRTQAPQDNRYTKLLFIAGHSTVCEDTNGGCSSLPVFRPPVDVLFTADYGSSVGLYGIFYDVLRRFCTGMNALTGSVQSFSLPIIEQVLTTMNRDPIPGQTGFFHNLGLNFHAKDSDTSNMFLFQPGEGFDTFEASGAYLVDITNVLGISRLHNPEIEGSHNLFSSPEFLHRLGIARTKRDVIDTGKKTVKGQCTVYGYNNPSFVKTNAKSDRAQRVKLSDVLNKLQRQEPDILHDALVVVVSCRGFEGAAQSAACTGYDSPRTGTFEAYSDDDDGGKGGGVKIKRRPRTRKRTCTCTCRYRCRCRCRRRRVRQPYKHKSKFTSRLKK